MNVPETVLKILIADDDPDILSITAKKVRSSGFEVVTAQDGIEALEKAMSDKPDILILDVSMPRRDGFEVLRLFRENPPDAKWRPVIIVSAQGEMEAYRKGFALEADHYLSKPCPIEDVMGAIYLMASLIPLRA